MGHISYIAVATMSMLNVCCHRPTKLHGDYNHVVILLSFLSRGNTNDSTVKYFVHKVHYFSKLLPGSAV